mmetsp:Transcript_29444/g.77428  ORF Transcript_29444/g.77428 Transcript_29444/m.77428 type:complete len:213 (-) Transcript_29444:3106-3744(-)
MRSILSCMFRRRQCISERVLCRLQSCASRRRGFRRAHRRKGGPGDGIPWRLGLFLPSLQSRSQLFFSQREFLLPGSKLCSRRSELLLSFFCPLLQWAKRSMSLGSFLFRCFPCGCFLRCEGSRTSRVLTGLLGCCHGLSARVLSGFKSYASRRGGLGRTSSCEDRSGRGAGRSRNNTTTSSGLGGFEPHPKLREVSLSPPCSRNGCSLSRRS